MTCIVCFILSYGFRLKYQNKGLIVIPLKICYNSSRIKSREVELWGVNPLDDLRGDVAFE